MKKTWFYKFFFYFLGMFVLAAGIVLNKKTMLGISPIVSVADCASQLLIGKINWLDLSNATFVWYVIFVLAEVVIHTIRKEYKKIPLDLIQILVSVIFTRCMSVLDNALPVFTSEEMAGTFFGTLTGRVIFLIIAVILTGIGAFLSISVGLAPNPGDGIVKAVSDCIKKPTGYTKNIFDISCVVTSTVIGLIVAHKLVSVGVGTVIAMIGVGRVVAICSKLVGEKLNKLCGLTKGD